MSERSNVLAWKAGVVKATSGSNPDFCAILTKRDFHVCEHMFPTSAQTKHLSVFFCFSRDLQTKVCFAFSKEPEDPRLAPVSPCPSVESASLTANPDFCAILTKRDFHVCEHMFPTSAPNQQGEDLMCTSTCSRLLRQQNTFRCFFCFSRDLQTKVCFAFSKEPEDPRLAPVSPCPSVESAPLTANQV